VPIRIAKTPITNKAHIDELQGWLEEMGTAAYGIFNRADEIEIKESSRSDAYHVYLEKINAINREISKGILGQTMTMDDGSSQSQAIVHSQVLEDIIEADTKVIQDWINEDLLPILRYHGIPIPENYYVELQSNTQLDPKDKIAIDSVLLANGYNLDNDYIENTYGCVLDKSAPRREQQQQVLSNDFF
jgi:phage gp29-like protein